MARWQDQATPPTPMWQLILTLLIWGVFLIAITAVSQ